MPARKTELARQALAAHGSTLDLRQRRTLIMCDGRRTLEELERLLGPDTEATLRQLQADGYLDDLEPVPAPRRRPLRKRHSPRPRAHVAAR